MVVSNCESPIVVVLSGSMEPAFYRGDLLFLTNYDDHEEKIRVGEIVVFKVSFKDYSKSLHNTIFGLKKKYIVLCKTVLLKST